MVKFSRKITVVSGDGMDKIGVLQGPNLNLLGSRQPNLYGNLTLESLHQGLQKEGEKLGLMVECHQSNYEGKLVELIQGAPGKYDFLILNMAAYTHTSIAIRDALLAVKIPAIEVHISNIYAREVFRHKSLLADIVLGQIAGLGTYGYTLALLGAANYLGQGGKNLV